VGTAAALGRLDADFGAVSLGPAQEAAPPAVLTPEPIVEVSSALDDRVGRSAGPASETAHVDGLLAWTSPVVRSTRHRPRRRRSTRSRLSMSSISKLRVRSVHARGTQVRLEHEAQTFGWQRSYLRPYPSRRACLQEGTATVGPTGRRSPRR
jgi:hypothetical protein